MACSASLPMREWEVTGWSFKLVFTGTNEHGHHSMVACMLWTMASTFSPPEVEQLSGGFFFHFTLWCLRTWTKMGNIKMEMKEHLGQAKSQWQSHKRKKYQSWQMQQGREDGYPFLPTPLPKLKKNWLWDKSNNFLSSAMNSSYWGQQSTNLTKKAVLTLHSKRL